MTVIAWDGTTLAADKFADIYGVAFRTTKVFRFVDGAGHVTLIATVGNAARGNQLLAWYKNGADASNFPPQPSEEDMKTNLVCITRDYAGCVRILRFESTAYPVILEDTLFADAYGRETTLAAMHCGKTAREAVELTSRLIPRIGGGVDTVTFDP